MVCPLCGIRRAKRGCPALGRQICAVCCGTKRLVEATSALAGTFETASRGVIYEQRPASMSAERLMGALKPVLDKAGQGGGSAFERDAAVVLRRVSEAARETAGENRRAFVDLLARMINRTATQEGQGRP